MRALDSIEDPAAQESHQSQPVLGSTENPVLQGFHQFTEGSIEKDPQPLSSSERRSIEGTIF